MMIETVRIVVVGVAVVGILGVISWLIERRQKARELNPVSVCVGCSFAHIQYSAKGRRAISCTYGGGVRLIKADVLYCTDYHSKNAEVRESQIGFAPAKLLAEPEAAAIAVQSEK